MSGGLEGGATAPGVAERWQELAREAAQPAPTRGECEIQRELLGLQIAGSPYAVPVERVREIVRLRPITRMPRVPAPILGVIALRGEIVQVVDLRMRLAQPAAEPTPKSRIVVLHGEDERVTGILVDAVLEVLRVPEESIRAAASVDSGAVVALCDRDGAFVSIVDIDRVLDFDDDA